MMEFSSMIINSKFIAEYIGNFKNESIFDATMSNCGDLSLLNRAIT